MKPAADAAAATPVKKKSVGNGGKTSTASNDGQQSQRRQSRIDRIDSLIESNRDLLTKPSSAGGDSLLAEVQARLVRPWCAKLPVSVSKRLPLLMRLWAGAKLWTWRLLLVYLLYALTVAAVNFYLQNQIEAYYNSDSYTDLSRGVSIAARQLAVWLGLPKMDRLQEVAGGKCVIRNPLYREPPNCCNCKFNVTVSKLTNVEKVTQNFEKLVTTGKARSFIIVNYDQPPVSYATIRQTALANEADVSVGYNRFIALSGPSVSGLRGLFADATAPPNDSAVLWRFGHVEALRHFRAHIQRPAFVSRSLEINLDRQFLFFGAEHTERVQLGSLFELEGQVYAVGLAGEIVFTVKSNPVCCKTAEKQVIQAAVLKPGRLLSLPSTCYEVSARRNGTGYAMAYMGSVAMAQHPASGGEKSGGGGGGKRKK